MLLNTRATKIHLVRYENIYFEIHFKRNNRTVDYHGIVSYVTRRSSPPFASLDQWLFSMPAVSLNLPFNSL